MEAQSSQSPVRRTEPWIALALCAAVLAAGVLEQFFRNRPDTGAFAPGWLTIVAAGLSAIGIVQLNGRLQWLRIQRILLWSGLLLMVWAANGLLFDLFRIVGLIPFEVDWPGLGTRTLALAAAVVLAHIALSRTAAPASNRISSWYGYAAFVLTLPYPFLRTWWVLRGTLGLAWPGAAGQGFEPWLACTPWLLAAFLSLLLISTSRWKPRRLLIMAGWSATAIVATIAPAACWSLITKSVSGELGVDSIATWVPCLFYISWFLWAIAAGAATRSYQLRSATQRTTSSM